MSLLTRLVKSILISLKPNVYKPDNFLSPEEGEGEATLTVKDPTSPKRRAMGLRMQLIAFFNSNLGIILLSVAMGTKHWAGREGKGMYVYEGLWEKCTEHTRKHGKPTYCQPLEESFGHYPNEYLAVIIPLFVSFGFHVILIILLITLFITGNLKLEKACAVFQFFVLLCTLIGLSIYSTVYDGNYYGLKWSCALGWASTLCMFASVVLLLIDYNNNK